MRAEKQLLKQEVVEKFHQFPSFVVMRYAGLSANTANDFRREVRKMGGDVEIMRKRVLEKAAHDVGIPLDASNIEGHIGIVFFGNNPLEGTKTVFQFSQDRDKVIQIIGGRFDGQLYSGEDVERLSKLPSQNEMRAQFLSVLEAPLAQTLGVIEALLASVPHCLENKSKAE